MRWIKFQFSMILNYYLLRLNGVDQVPLSMILNYNSPRLGRVDQVLVLDGIKL